MTRVGQVAIFAGTSALIIGGYHRYLWARLVRDAAMPSPWRTIATIAITVFAIALPVSIALTRGLPRDVMRPIAFVVYTWLGASFLLLVGVAVGDLVRLAVSVANWGTTVDPARRVALSRIVAITAASLAGVGTIAGLASALGRVRVVRHRIPLARLPEAMNGTKIVQLSDIHIGPTLGRGFLDRIVDEANALAPDLIAITGDLVDGSVAELRDHVAPIGRLRARHGVYFVTGNHEYYSGVDEWLTELQRLGVRALRNEHVSIGAGDVSFDLAGVDDWSAMGHAEGHGHDLPRALAGRDATRELVLLAHQPRSADQAAAAGVGLQLSGHTHGGQIVPWNFAVLLQTRFVAGLYRLRDTWIYVSRGTGFWGPPMRLGAPAEVTLLVLERAAAATAGERS